MPEHMKAEQFRAELESGPYAWPGGYRRRFIMADGESLCFDCATSEQSRILEEIDSGFDRDWIPAACEILWEGEPEQCAHCNKEIESAYGPPETAAQSDSAAAPSSEPESPRNAPKPLIEQFAAAFMAWQNCQKSGNVDWLGIWESRLEALAKEHLPSGSGFDSGSAFQIDESRPDRLIFSTSFHHMNDSGFYDGWTEHRVIATPSFIGGFDLKITGRDRRAIKDYIGETFGQALSESVPMPED